MTDLSMYDYLLRDAEVIDETDGGVTLNCRGRDWDAVGYDLTDLPISLPGDMGGYCENWEWDEKQEGHKIMAHLDADYVKRLKSTRIRIDHDAWKETGISDVRRPFFMVRGKSVSYEQVKFLLKNELEMFWVPDFFQAEDMCVESGGIFKYYDLNSEEGFGKLLPDRNGSSGGWLWDTGEIGGSGWDDKYPEFKECMPRWFSLALKYPFLDMVAGYTRYPEHPCNFCPLKEYYEYHGLVRDAYERGESPKRIKELELTMKSYERDVKDESGENWGFPCRGHRMQECKSYFQSGRSFWESGKQALGLSYAGIVYPEELAEDVVMTVRVHEGSLEVYTGVEAVRVFKEYDKNYGFADTWRYAAYDFQFFHELLQETLITEDTLRECLAEEGMDPDKCMEHLVQVFGLKPELMKRGKPCLR